MDGLLAPGALIAGLLAIPIFIVYMLRTRRPRRVVASTFLWREATRNVAASRPWDRIKPSVLLLLQLLLLAALVLALARPYRSAPGVAGDHLIVVIDASGSMLATDVRPTRLEAAHIEAKRLIDTLSAGATISVVVASGAPHVAVPSTQDRAEAGRAIDDIEATDAPAAFAEAFLMAESLELPGRPATMAVVSDGGLTSTERRLMPAGSVFRGVGASADNVSVERLEVGETARGLRAFVGVRNFFDSERDVDLTILRDGTEVASTVLTVPGGSPLERSFDLGAEGGRIEARIAGRDPLVADDRALAVLERDRPRRITLVTPGNLFLESLVRTLPGADVEVAVWPRPDRRTQLAEMPAGTPPDLVVYDRVAVPKRVETPALFIAPTALPAGVTVTGSIKNPAITHLAPSDPLLAQADLSALSIARAQRAEIRGSRTLVGTSDSPLIATWTDGTRRRVWVGFDLHESNLPVQVAFPILFDHLLSWLAGTEPLGASFAGDALELPPVAGGEEVRVAIPGGRGATLASGQTFVDTERAGFYEIEYSDGEDVLARRTVALSFPTSESDLEPRALEARPDEARPGLTATARRPVIVWVLAAALLVLLLEWWWAHGRPAPRAVTSMLERRKAA